MRKTNTPVPYNDACWCASCRVQFHAVTLAAATDRSDDPAGTRIRRPGLPRLRRQHPLDPRVAAEVQHYLVEEYGNAGSRTAPVRPGPPRPRVQHARRQVADVVAANPTK